jgi:hypothetical protein
VVIHLILAAASARIEPPDRPDRGRGWGWPGRRT